MRILHIITSLGRGGAEVLLSNTIPLLREQEQHLITFQGPHDQLGNLEPFLSSHRCLGITGHRHWPKGILLLRKAIKEIKPDLIHVHLLVPGLLTKIAAPKNIPLFYSLHNPYSIDAFAANRWALGAERFTAHKRHHLIGVSKLVLQDYQKHVPDSGTGDVVYNMVGDEFFKTPPHPAYTPGTPLRCVSVGNLKPQKNYRLTFDAFKLLAEMPITVDIYGVGPELEFWTEYVEREGVKNVRLMGQASAIESVLHNYDLYLISSSYEGFGIALLEAMATGTPALTSDIPVFREVAADTVLYFSLEDGAYGLAEALKGVYEGREVITGNGVAAKQQAMRVSASENYIKALNQVYTKYL